MGSEEDRNGACMVWSGKRGVQELDLDGICVGTVAYKLLHILFLYCS